MTTEQSGGVGDTKTARSTRKGPSAFRTIGEASEELGVPQHVLRFWETKFSQLKPLKRAGGRRYYRPEDMELLTRIRDLLYQEGFTIKGAKRSLSQKGGAKTPSKVAPDETGAESDVRSEESAEKAEAPVAVAEAPAVEPTAAQAPAVTPPAVTPPAATPPAAKPPAATPPAAKPPAADPPAAQPPAAPLFDALPAGSEDKEEAQRLRAALEEVHRDLRLLRQAITARLS
ncbi:MAG: MerR family transcriptional regulator [Kiloniellales bacterium]